MKRIITDTIMISALLISISSINSCSKVEDIVDNITVPVPFSIPVNVETQIPFATANTTDYIRSPEIPLNLDLDAKIKENFPSLSINNLRSAKLSSFSIEYISSDNDVKLDAVKNARLLIKAPNLAEKLIANVENNTSETALSFTPVSDLELLDYLKSTQSSLIIEMQGSRVAVDLMKVRINASFKIQVGL